MYIFRGYSDTIETNELRRILIENSVDILILRLPSLVKSTHSRLVELGFPVLHADTLVYNAINLEKRLFPDC